MSFLKNLIIDCVRFIQYGDLPTNFYTKRGMVIGKNFNRQSGCKFDISHCWLINIGDDATFSSRVSILAHDDSPRIYTGYGKVGTVTIGNNVFVGAGVTILLNTKIGNDVIIGAGSIVTKSIPNDSIVVGVPAKVIGKTSEYIAKCKEEIEKYPNFDLSYTMYSKKKMSKSQKREMKTMLDETYGYQQLWMHKD